MKQGRSITKENNDAIKNKVTHSVALTTNAGIEAITEEFAPSFTFHLKVFIIIQISWHCHNREGLRNSGMVNKILRKREVHQDGVTAITVLCVSRSKSNHFNFALNIPRNHAWLCQENSLVCIPHSRAPPWDQENKTQEEAVTSWTRSLLQHGSGAKHQNGESPGHPKKVTLGFP